MKSIAVIITIFLLWGLAFLMAKSSDYTLFESFMIVSVSGLIANAVGGWFEE